VIDHLWVRNFVENGMTDHGLDHARAVVAGAYDRPYRTTKELYGEANDEDDFGSFSEEQVDSPFQQVNPKSTPRPAASLSPLTPFDENGFAGLDAPLN
jgi:hypothetical protein